MECAPYPNTQTVQHHTLNNFRQTCIINKLFDSTQFKSGCFQKPEVIKYYFAIDNKKKFWISYNNKLWFISADLLHNYALFTVGLCKKRVFDKNFNLLQWLFLRTSTMNNFFIIKCCYLNPSLWPAFIT